MKVYIAGHDSAKTIAATLPETAFEIERKLVLKNRLEDDPNW